MQGLTKPTIMTKPLTTTLRLDEDDLEFLIEGAKMVRGCTTGGDAYHNLVVEQAEDMLDRLEAALDRLAKRKYDQ